MNYAKYLIVGKISDLKIEMLCNGKVLKNTRFYVYYQLRPGPAFLSRKIDGGGGCNFFSILSNTD